ncbi:hypothetical protein KR50_03540 [Jeotgalibacillus campisalis]|uniref:Uncharacterized protein n=1 Tax=Jeotgalibacillus campisalis TaxID=220754 RepID=A0A0C2RS23_9BACL|nr:hypothetical protein KR50_03540 [Jeotgalibacillus campisalis]
MQVESVENPILIQENVYALRLNYDLFLETVKELAGHYFEYRRKPIACLIHKCQQLVFLFERDK